MGALLNTTHRDAWAGAGVCILLCMWGPNVWGQNGDPGGRVIAAVSQDAGGQDAEGPGWKAAEEVQRLADPKPLRRKLAAHRLRAMGGSAAGALREGLGASQLEVRLSSERLLADLAERQLEQSLQRFRAGATTANCCEEMPGWKLLSEAIGDHADTRRLYEGMLRRHSATLVWLDQVAGIGGGSDGRHVGGRHSGGVKVRSDELAISDADIAIDQFLPVDSLHAEGADPTRWALILLVTSQERFRQTPVLISRIRGALLNQSVRNRLLLSSQAATLKRLITHWLRGAAKHYVSPTLLKIALFYECEVVGVELATACLQSRQSAPASVATSLILLAKLDPLEAAQRLEGWEADRRICHVWQMVAARRRAVQTQVGDVAVALRLHLAGVDPRRCGFKDLQADPMLIYREFSMGFEHEAEREAAHLAAMEMLGQGS